MINVEELRKLANDLPSAFMEALNQREREIFVIGSSFTGIMQELERMHILASTQQKILDSFVKDHVDYLKEDKL